MQLRSRSDRDDGAQTAGQRRATAELERIRREQAREPDRDELIPRAPQSAGHSPRHSMSAANEVPSITLVSLLIIKGPGDIFML